MIKHILKVEMGLSERLLKKLKYADQILCNSVPVHTNFIVKENDVVEAIIDFVEERDEIIPENIPLEIVFEDECLIIINKQPNIVVHPTHGHRSGTIANGLAFHYNQRNEFIKIRPVSRLDRDTTGIIIFAKNQFVQEHLIQQMQEKTFLKQYYGVVLGIPECASGTIDLPIDRKPNSIMERQISVTGAPSITHYEVVERFNSSSLLRFKLDTGRTHQIRVHCQAIGHPLLGDTLYPFQDDKLSKEYASISDLINRQALHSYMVSFLHPLTGKTMEFQTSLPSDMLSVLEAIKRASY